MTIYAVINKTTGTEAYRYTDSQPVEWVGYGFAEFDHVAQPDIPQQEETVPLVFSGRRILTKLEFRSLFPLTALLAIDRFEVQFESAQFLTDDQKDSVRTAFNDYHEAQDVDLDDPRWVPGLGLYVSIGIMTAEEVTEVLRG